MKKHHAVAGALVMALMAAGAGAQTQSRSLPAATLDVSVDGGSISVSQNGVRTPSGTVSLVWQLRTEGYRFNSGSIDFGDAQAYFACATFNSGLSIRCTKSDQAPSGQLPYRIRLSDGQALLDMPQPNVFIMND